MKLECDLWEIFVLVCFFFFWRPGDHAKTLCSVPHIHFRRHWNQSIILVNLDVKNGPKNIVLSWALFTLYWIAFFFFRGAPTVLMCEQKPYPVWFSWRRKSSPVQYKHSLSLSLGIQNTKILRLLYFVFCVCLKRFGLVLRSFRHMYVVYHYWIHIFLTSASHVRSSGFRKRGHIFLRNVESGFVLASSVKLH